MHCVGVAARVVQMAVGFNWSDLQLGEGFAAPVAPVVKLLNDTGALNTDLVTNDAHLSISPLVAGNTRAFVISTNGVAGTSATAYVPPTASGVYTVYVTDTDASGNTVTSAITFTLDVDVPAAPTLSLLHDTGHLATDLITRDGTLAFAGAEAGALVEFFVVPSGAGTGSWTSILPTFTTDGMYTVLVRQTDLAGNVATSTSTFTFTLDVTAPVKPTVTLTNDADKDHIIDKDGLTVVSAEANGTVEFSIDGGTTWTTTEPDKLANGDYKVQVRVTDVAGNISAVEEVAFTVKKTVPAGPDHPTITNDSGASESDGITNEIPTFTADNLPAGAKLQFQLDGTTTWVDVLSSDLADGDYTVHIRVVAENGSISTAVDDVSFTLDRTAPNALVATLTNGVESVATTTVTDVPAFDFGTSDEAGAAIEFSVDNGASWLSLDALGTLSAGTYSILFHQIDLAGNVSDVSNAVDFDLGGGADDKGGGGFEIGGNDGRDGVDFGGLDFGGSDNDFGLF